MPVKENAACAHKPGWGICLLPTWLFSFVALVDLRKTFPGVEAKLRRCLDEPIRLDHLQTILMPLARIGQ